MEVSAAGKVAPMTCLTHDDKGELSECWGSPMACLQAGRSDRLPKIGRAVDGRPVRFTTLVDLPPGRAVAPMIRT